MDPPPYTPPSPIAQRDFETASIRSAAPSYISSAPTYTSNFSPPTTTTSRVSPFLSSPHHPRANSTPSLESFHIASWSRTQPSNPTSRHYHSVAHRRASALTAMTQATLLSATLSGADGVALMRRRMDEEARARDMATLEDPHLVGEVAAEQNRRERLARESGPGVLEMEDRRWDWLLAQMSDWEERDRSWEKFRREVEGGKRGKLARRLGIVGKKG